MKKIAIITFQESNNFGAMLQAYGLKTAVEKNGCYAEIVNYHCRAKEDQYSTKPSKNRSFLVNMNILLSRNIYSKSSEMFDAFRRNYLGLSSHIVQFDELQALNGQYDAFICGSDQVWNPKSIKGDTTYFLSFVEDKRKRISYAPSVGLTSIPSEYRNMFAEGVKQISCLSVREATAAKIIKELVGLDAKVVVDPTLLIEQKQWEKIAGERVFKDDYILLYNLDYTPDVIRFAKQLSKRVGLPVLMPVRTVRDYKDGFKGCIWGPEEFLAAVRDAKYVITTSFHGMMMSVIFEKDFFVMDKKSGKNQLSSRIDDFLELAGLQNRKFKGDFSAITEKVDYSNVKKKLEPLIKESQCYLSEAIKGATDYEKNI